MKKQLFLLLLDFIALACIKLLPGKAPNFWQALLPTDIFEESRSLARTTYIIAERP